MTGFLFISSFPVAGLQALCELALLMIAGVDVVDVVDVIAN